MESPPPDRVQTGVATLPSPHQMRSLIAASQGPRPLSNVLSYHRFAMDDHYSIALSYSLRERASASTTSSLGNPPDNRKPPPTGTPTPDTVAPARRYSSSSTDEDMPPLMRHGGTSSSEDDFDPSVPSPQEFDPSPLEQTPPFSLARAERQEGDDDSLNVSTPKEDDNSFDTSPPIAAAASRSRAGEARARAMVAARKRSSEAASIPAAKLKSDPDDDMDYGETGSCCICMCDPDEGEAATIDGCEHGFCFECIEKWAERENTCPLCKNRFSRIKRCGKRRKGQKYTKKVKQRDQRSDFASASALEGILAGLSANAGFSSSIARLIFQGFGPTSGGGGVIEFAAPPRSGGSIPRRSARHQIRYRNPLSQIEDALFSDNEDEEGSDDETSGYTDFVDRMRRGNAGLLGTYPLTAPATMRRRRRHTARMSVDPLQMTRSYATNAHDRNAGVSAENALEIEDDSDDDEVEVVDVRNTGASI